jgi:hypothetical protein
MTELFQAELFATLAVITPLLAIIGLIVSLSSENLRRGLPSALVCSGIGFFVVLVTFGGGSSDFQQLAIILGLLFAILAACAGFLLGLGGYCLCNGRKFLGVLTLIVGLLLPSLFFYAKYLQPKLTGNDLAWWQGAFKNGVTSEMEKEADGHLSAATKEQLMKGLGYAAPGSIQPSAIVLLYKKGIPMDAYVPFPPELARELIKHPPPYSKDFVTNPSLPPDVLEKLSMSDDTSFFEALGRNPSLPNDVAEKLLSRCETIIATPDDKSVSYMHPNLDKVNAGDCLFSMARNPAMPVDVLDKLSEKRNDLQLLEHLAGNPSLPETAEKTLIQEFEAVVSAPPNPADSDQVGWAKRGLMDLARNPHLTSELLDEMSGYDNPFMYGLLAENPSLADDTAQKLKTKFEAMISGLGVMPKTGYWPETAQQDIWIMAQDGLRALARRDKISTKQD